MQYVDAAWEAHEGRRRRVSFGETAQALDVPFSEYIKETPARDPTPSGDVAVPFLQALISGIVVNVLGLAVLLATGGEWRFAFVAGAAVAAVAWFSLLSDNRRLLRVTERIIGIDGLGEPRSAGDGYIGEPAGSAEIGVRLRVDEDEATTKYGHLPIDVEALRVVARGVLDGQSFAVSTWTGRGKPLSRAQFEELRGWLFKQGYARWENPDNHAQGVAFTAKGLALWRALVEEDGA